MRSNLSSCALGTEFPPLQHFHPAKPQSEHQRQP
jgi:hypothetical protein